MSKPHAIDLPPLRRKKKRLIVAGIWLVILVVGGLLAVPAFRDVHEQSRLKSCFNHRSFIPSELLEQYPGGDLESRSFRELPYDPDLPGYGMLAKYVAADRNVSGSGEFKIEDFAYGQNCHHGAPNEGNGGWNAVNLPPEKWEALWEAHQKSESDVWIPFFWCGNPSSSQMRAGGWTFKTNTGWTIEKGQVDDEMLEHLNDCLEAIGEKPMDWNVPDGVDWDIFNNDETYTRIPDHIGADGSVVSRITPRRNEVE